MLLVLLAGVLLLEDDIRGGSALVTGWTLVASMLGVARGEFLIPTLMMLFGTDVKLAGSLSLAVSLPTMLVGFTRYSRDQNFSVIWANSAFLVMMAAGSIVGTYKADYCSALFRAA